MIMKQRNDVIMIMIMIMIMIVIVILQNNGALEPN